MLRQRPAERPGRPLPAPGRAECRPALAPHRDLIRESGGQVTIADRRLLAFREVGTGRAGDPVLDYAWQTSGRYGIRVRYFDTGLAFGSGSKLDDLARTIAGVGKLEGISEADKADMLAALHRDPARTSFNYPHLDCSVRSRGTDRSAG